MTIVSTDLIQHLVALVEDKNLYVAKTKLLVADQGIEAAGSGDDNVWMSIFVRKGLNVFLHWSPTVKDCGLDFGKVLAETGVFVLDLISELTSMTHDQYGALSSNGLNLLQRCEDEDSRLPEARFGLAEYVGTEDGLRNAHLLNCSKAMAS